MNDRLYGNHYQSPSSISSLTKSFRSTYSSTSPLSSPSPSRKNYSSSLTSNAHQSSNERLNQSFNRGKDGIFRPKSLLSLATEIDFVSSNKQYQSKPISIGTSSRVAQSRDASVNRLSDYSSSSYGRSVRSNLTTSSNNNNSYYSNYNDNQSYYGKSSTPILSSSPSNYRTRSNYVPSSSSSYRFTTTYYTPKVRERPLLSNLRLKFADTKPTRSSNGFYSSSSGGSRPHSSSIGSSSRTTSSSTSSNTSSHHNSVSSNETLVAPTPPPPPLERNKFLIKFREHNPEPLSSARRRSSISWHIPGAPNFGTLKPTADVVVDETIQEDDGPKSPEKVVNGVDKDESIDNHSETDEKQQLSRWSGSFTLDMLKDSDLPNDKVTELVPIEPELKEEPQTVELEKQDEDKVSPISNSTAPVVDEPETIIPPKVDKVKKKKKKVVSTTTTFETLKESITEEPKLEEIESKPKIVIEPAKALIISNDKSVTIEQSKPLNHVKVHKVKDAKPIPATQRLDTKMAQIETTKIAQPVQFKMVTPKAKKQISNVEASPAKSIEQKSSTPIKSVEPTANKQEDVKVSFQVKLPENTTKKVPTTTKISDPKSPTKVPDSILSTNQVDKKPEPVSKKSPATKVSESTSQNKVKVPEVKIQEEPKIVDSVQTKDLEQKSLSKSQVIEPKTMGQLKSPTKSKVVEPLQPKVPEPKILSKTKSTEPVTNQTNSTTPTSIMIKDNDNQLKSKSTNNEDKSKPISPKPNKTVTFEIGKPKIINNELNKLKTNTQTSNDSEKLLQPKLIIPEPTKPKPIKTIKPIKPILSRIEPTLKFSTQIIKSTLVNRIVTLNTCVELIPLKPKPLSEKVEKKVKKKKSSENSDEQQLATTTSKKKVKKVKKQSSKELVSDDQPLSPKKKKKVSVEFGDQTNEQSTPTQRKAPKKILFREYTITDFTFRTVLGRGSFGKVLLAELNGHETFFAVKCLKKKTVIDDDDVESIMIERKVLAFGSSNPFICKLFCTFQNESHLFFAMEWCPGGDLMFHVQKEGKFPEEKARFYSCEILCALWFMHKRGIIYRDLKLDNIMIFHDGHIRLVDFGMCQGKMYREELLPSNFCGTPEYMAPEIIKGVKYNHSVDYWALGVVIYEMCVGTSPFHGTDEDELLWNVCHQDVHYPRFLSAAVRDLIALLLKRDPKERLGMSTCQWGKLESQRWFQGVDWNSVEFVKTKPPFIPTLANDADVSYFDRYFTKEAPCISMNEKDRIDEKDQLLFEGFNYTNHNMTD